MTGLLTKALGEAEKLPRDLQDELARQLLEDIEGELRWDETLEKSHNQLSTLADRALEEFKAGRTRKMGFDEL